MMFSGSIQQYGACVLQWQKETATYFQGGGGGGLPYKKDGGDRRTF